MIVEVLNESDDPLPDHEKGSNTLEHDGIFLIRWRDIHGFRRPSIFVAPVSRDGDTVLGVI